MKKRTPKQQARITEKKILEENKDFYNDIIATHYPKKNRRKSFALLGSSAAIILTVIMLLIFLLPSEVPGAPDSPKKRYLLENEVSVLSDLVMLNSSLPEISIDINSNYEFVIWRTYDSEYGDDLFFWISITGDEKFETMTLFVYTNPDYEYQKQIIEEPIKMVSIGGFDLKYKENIAIDSDDIFTFNYYAKTEHNDVAIYFEYEQLWYEEETNFFKFFQETIKML